MTATLERERTAELNLPRPPLADWANAIGVKLDKAEHMRISAVADAQNVLTNDFDGDRDKFGRWFRINIEQGDTKPHRSWKQMEGYLNFIRTRVERPNRPQSVPEALGSLEKKWASNARYEAAHPERNERRRQFPTSPEPRRFKANVAEPDTTDQPAHESDTPLLEIKVVARNEWQRSALAAAPTTADESERRYFALGWEQRAVQRRLLELLKAEGETLRDAQRFFPTKTAWDRWIKSLKTCPISTGAVNSALSASEPSEPVPLEEN